MTIEGTERRQRLLKTLGTAFPAAPLTIKKIAELLHVSVRTVHYDLDLLTEELAGSNMRICRKAHKGVWLEQAAPDKSQPVAVENPVFMSPKERRYHIILAMLGPGWHAIDEMAAVLQISRNTLLADLKPIQEILERRGLTYESKRGAGVRVGGSEQDIRDMYIHIFARAEYDFRAGVTAGEILPEQQPFYDYTQALPLQEMAADLIGLLNKYGILGNDMSTNRMICALAVQLRRLQQGYRLRQQRQVEFLGNEGEALKALAKEIAACMTAYHQDAAKAGEVQYITKELLHSRIYLFSVKGEKQQRQEVNVSALELARKLVEYAQVWLGNIYQNDDELIYNLAMHLQPAIERARFGIVLTNPLLGQIKEQYQSLYMIAHKAADKLTRNMGIAFTEDEIGYLTIHLGAAVERKRLLQNKKLEVLLVCGNGVGTANLLAMTLKNHLPYIHISKILSLYKLEESALAGIDMVISTVPLELEHVAVLRVSPIATVEEIKVIESQIAYFYNKKFSDSGQITESKALGLPDLLSPEMIELECEARDWSEAVRSAGQILVKSGAVSDGYVERMVDCVREMGPYIVVCPGVAMPHARYEDGVNKVAISFLRLKKPVYFASREEKKPVDMLFAFSTTDDKAHLQLMQDLWLIFNDKDTLNRLRKSGSKEEILGCIRERRWEGAEFA
jgi:transcriptional antiterminator/mannitol/fructose-specific phosphotransferase system IIA component (Ntr-type)